MLAQILNGLVLGSGYALAAVGISYTFGIARVMNFAYGTFYMLSAFALLTLTQAGLPYWASALGALAILAVLGLVVGRLFVLPVVQVSEDSVMIVTLGISVALVNFALYFFGSNISTLDTPLSEYTVSVVGARVDGQELLLMVLAPAATLALVQYMNRTVTGSRIRAVSQHPDLSGATGVNVRATYLFAIVVGVSLAGLVGVLQGPNQVMTVFIGDALLLKAFTVAALAGMGHLWGAFVVGLGFGITETLSSTYISTSYTPAILYGLLVVILIFFPRGLFRGAAS